MHQYTKNNHETKIHRHDSVIIVGTALTIRTLDADGSAGGMNTFYLLTRTQ